MIRSPRLTCLEGALALDRPVERIGRALWMYLELVSHADRKGLVLRTPAQLATELSVPENDAARWLKRLEDLGLITVQSPPPFLVIRLPLWPGRGRGASDKTAGSGQREPLVQEGVPVSSLQSASAAEGNKASGERGAGEGVAALAVRVLGAADRNEVDRLLAAYPETLVRRALDRVKNTPGSRIRKSRLALFRYLLTTFSNETTHADK